MYGIVCDPSSGGIKLYLTEIRSGSLMFVVCLIGVWQRNFWTCGVCVRYDGLSQPVVNRTVYKIQESTILSQSIITREFAERQNWSNTQSEQSAHVTLASKGKGPWGSLRRRPYNSSNNVRHSNLSKTHKIFIGTIYLRNTDWRVTQKFIDPSFGPSCYNFLFRARARACVCVFAYCNQNIWRIILPRRKCAFFFKQKKTFKIRKAC